MLKLQPGQTASFDLGRLTVRVDRHHDGVSFTVDHHPELNRPFTDLNEAAAYYRYLRDNGHRPVRDIVAEAGVLISASAVLAEAAADLPAPATLDAYRHRAQPTTRAAHVHTKPLGPAARDRIRCHNNGVVTLLPGQNWLLLQSIVDRRLGTPTFANGKRGKIASVQLNSAGWVLAAQLGGQAVAA
ncbi:hypothetical protein GCM10010172_07660 [Paractinoplanes ferrugineus]|uniref:Uncharacterized protein n=1 Tax=Paractinoplanes ferrugineus TaxID=113564 RepID=A0A919JCM2_9ACTN|nr:hypothetical protein [Actinoplanes ferrugineus]GIE16869.1 hypothetical protein Afe05nite_87090 [Actinoplanes ferrugineus]